MRASPGAHWNHDRAAYHCRHGRSNAKAKWERPLRNIYAREDQALIFLAHHVPELGNDDPVALTAHLADSQIAILCENNSSRLELEGLTVSEDRPPRMPPEQKKRLPRQRGASIEAVGK